MIMADVLKIFLLVIGAMLMCVAYGLAACALFPRSVERWNQKLRSRPLLSTLVGAVASSPFVLAGGQAFGQGAQVSGILILGLPVFFGMIGASALSLEIGRGLTPTHDDGQLWRAVARGGTILVFVLLLPFLGWLVLIPAVLAQGVGVLMLTAVEGLRKRSKGDLPGVLSTPGIRAEPSP